MQAKTSGDPAAAKPVTTKEVRAAKGVRKLAMLTAYDYPTAALLDRCGVDMILVGDSLGMVVLGREDTLSVTLDEMIHHCRAVRRAVQRAMVVGDMPFLSYESGPEQALHSAGRLFREAGVRAVKLEGAGPYLPQVRALTNAGVPVVGHVGLTPQRVAQLGGFKAQGDTAEAAAQLLRDARDLEAAGCFCLVLEAMPAAVAQRITARVSIPTIGIGAGPGCDGQVLVLHDMLGLFDRFLPRFVKQYAQLGNVVQNAVDTYCREVRTGAFPGPEHCFAISDQELARWDDLENAPGNEPE